MSGPGTFRRRRGVRSPCDWSRRRVLPELIYLDAQDPGQDRQRSAICLTSLALDPEDRAAGDASSDGEGFERQARFTPGLFEGMNVSELRFHCAQCSIEA